MSATVAAAPRQRGTKSRALRTLVGCFRGKPTAQIALGFLLFVILVAIFAPQISPDNPLTQNLSGIFQGPSLHHLLGTDELGRDTLSRVIYAARVALPASAMAVGIAVGVGIPIGMAVGYAGGIADQLSMRAVDALLALPGLVVAIAILAALGPGLIHAMLALGFLAAPGFARLTRGVVLAAKEDLYVDAARVVGERPRRILRREILPNISAPLLVHTTISFGGMLLAEAGLSFIGLGVQPPQASWGSMLTDANNEVYHDAFLAVPPGLALLLTVLSINIVGDALRSGLALSRFGATSSRAAAAARRRGAAVIRRRALAATRSELPAPGTGMYRNTVPDGASPADVILSVRDLTVQLAGADGPVTLVDNVSFDVRRGETLGVVGESGCGKSMTALAIMGLLPGGAATTGGQVLFGGGDLAVMTDRQLDRIRGNRIGMIFQDPTGSLDPAFKIIDQVAEPLRAHRKLSRREAYRQAIELLDRVHLPDAARKARCYPHQLSGGQAQRVMIAAALACEPDLLIADEPTTALDVTVQGQILDLLAELQRESGLAIMLITHDLGVVADSCERVVVMYAGQVLESARADPLFTRPRHPYTESLLLAVPDSDRPVERLIQISGQVPEPADWSARACRFADRCQYVQPACTAAMPALARHAGDHGADDDAARCARAGELQLEGSCR